MVLNVVQEVAALQRMTVTELKAKYAEVCGAAARSGNRQWLVKRIAWRMQAHAEGDLSERARRRALELADDAELRMQAPRHGTTPAQTADVHRAPAGVSGARHGGTERHGVDSQTDATRPFSPRRSHRPGRLPLPGEQLTRRYKGRTIIVTVLQDGFECQGEVFPSLSAVARAITGAHWNGYHFFGLRHRGSGT